MNSVKGESSSSIQSAVTFSLKDMPNWNFGTFLTNHDQDRVMSVLGGNVDKAKIAAFLLLTSPGTPFIYYGEEIGMVGQKPDVNIRRPMQWSADQYAGFSSHIPWEAVDQGYIQMNVQKEQGAFDSLLTSYQNLIHLRTSHPALSQGDYLPVTSSTPEVYAFMRKDGSETLLMVVNLSRNSISDYSLSAQKIQLENGTYLVSDLQSGEKAAQFEVINGTISHFKPGDTLPPYSGTIFTIVKQ